MESLYERVRPYRSVSLIGMCKNAGKTTTMNRLIRELREAGVCFACTTVGRDGESTDVVTNTVKPGIFVGRGTLIATAAGLLKYCDITKEILETTGIHTPMGEVVVLRALSDGFVQLAGPSITAQLPPLAQLFSSFGAEKMLIDGALGRKSLCSRRVSDSTILCTGASYSKNMDVVVRDTAFICSLLQLPEYEVCPGGEEILPEGRKYIPLTKEGCPWTEGTGAAAETGKPPAPEQLWNRRNRAQPPVIYVRGALTDAVLRPMLKSGADMAGRTLVCKDGSRILVSAELYEKCRMRGLSFAVRDPIRLLAVTVNPFSASGFHFDRNEFLDRMTQAVQVPVYDVRTPREG